MRLISLAIAAMLLVCAGCGSTGPGLDKAGPLLPTDFSLRVLSDSFIDSGAADEISLRLSGAGDEVTAEVVAGGARGLKALYFELEYDAGRFHPLSAEAAQAMSEGGELISLYLLDERGRVTGGQVLANYSDCAGLNGTAVLARLRFGRGAQPALRQASAAGPPQGSRSRPELKFMYSGTGNDYLYWDYYHCGDYDQNGVVNISDLTQVGQLFGQQVIAAEYPAHAEVVDGDENGVINIADITPIGANFLSSASGGYNVYTSGDSSDAPEAWDAPNGPGASLLAKLPFSAATGTPAQDRKCFQLALADVQPGSCWWIRPTDGAADGAASNYCMLDAPLVTLTVANPPPSGDGSAADPYLAGPFDVYTLILDFLESGGDMSCDPQTVWVVEPTEAAAVDISSGHAVLTISPEYIGSFSVSAEHGEATPWIRTLYFGMANDVPVAEVCNPPQNGDGSTADPYLVDPATDYALSLCSVPGEDLSTDPSAVWDVLPAPAGVVDCSGSQAMLRVDDALALNTGFTVGASYGGYRAGPLMHFKIALVGWLTLELTNPPAGGDGSEANPYMADNATDYIFTLTDPVDGDVSVDPDSVWTVTPAAAGTIDTSGGQAVLNVENSFGGTLSVSATYNGAVPQPAAIWLCLPQPPELEIYPDPADGDWPAKQPADPGSGHDQPYYILPTDDSIQYSLLADDSLGAGGNSVDVSSLLWHAFPGEFMVTWVGPGTFTSNQLTNCYLFALQGALESNHVYVEQHDTP